MSASVAERVASHAAGALAAQRFVHGLREGICMPADALAKLHEVQIEHGVASAAAEGFLAELAKRAR